MRTSSSLLSAAAALIFAATLDYVSVRMHDLGLGPPPPIIRILIAVVLNIAFAGVTAGLMWLILRRGFASTVASASFLAIGILSVLYGPLSFMGLPLLSQLLTARWNPLTRVIFQGGLHSFLSIESAVVLIGGAMVLLSQAAKPTRARSMNDAA